MIKIIKNSGLVHAVYGNGKGKTTSAMGLAIRAAGAGYQVDIVQFMKDGRSSEVSLLRKMPGINYYCPGPHDFQHLDNSPNVKSLEHARLNLKYAKSCSTNGGSCTNCLREFNNTRGSLNASDIIIFPPFFVTLINSSIPSFCSSQFGKLIKTRVV